MALGVRAPGNCPLCSPTRNLHTPVCFCEHLHQLSVQGQQCVDSARRAARGRDLLRVRYRARGRVRVRVRVRVRGRVRVRVRVGVRVGVGVRVRVRVRARVSDV